MMRHPSVDGDLRVQPKAADMVFQHRPLWPISDDQEMGGQAAGQLGKGRDQMIRAMSRLQRPGEAHDKGTRGQVGDGFR